MYMYVYSSTAVASASLMHYTSLAPVQYGPMSRLYSTQTYLQQQQG